MYKALRKLGALKSYIVGLRARNGGPRMSNPENTAQLRHIEDELHKAA